MQQRQQRNRVDPQSLEDEIMSLFTVHVIGNAEKPLTPEEVFQRIMDMPREERVTIIHHYLQESS